jgi:hypothetical protein
MCIHIYSHVIDVYWYVFTCIASNGHVLSIEDYIWGTNPELLYIMYTGRMG